MSSLKVICSTSCSICNPLLVPPQLSPRGSTSTLPASDLDYLFRKYKRNETVIAYDRQLNWDGHFVAKILEIGSVVHPDDDQLVVPSYRIRYVGWSKRYDECVMGDSLLKHTPENEKLTQEYILRHDKIKNRMAGKRSYQKKAKKTKTPAGSKRVIIEKAPVVEPEVEHPGNYVSIVQTPVVVSAPDKIARVNVESTSGSLQSQMPEVPTASEFKANQVLIAQFEQEIYNTHPNAWRLLPQERKMLESFSRRSGVPISTFLDELTPEFCKKVEADMEMVLKLMRGG